MANEYFQPGSIPAPNAPGSSAVMRQEFASISAGFDKLPALAGNANEIVAVDATGTKLITTGAKISDYVTKDGIFTLTNKTISWADNTFPGFGTGATKDAGKGAGQVLLLENNMQLPSIDGSLLTGLNTGMISGVVGIAQGGTGGTNLNEAQQNLGIDLKAPILNPAFTGAPSAPTPPTGDTSARLATTFFVTNTLVAIGAMQPGDDPPKMDGIAAAGTDQTKASRQDHVHPSDTSRAPTSAGTAVGTSFVPAGSIAANNVQTALQELDAEKANLVSPTFTGVPQAPTVADPSDTTTKIATTAWVQTRLVQIPVGVQLSDMPALNLAAAAAAGVGVEASRYDHVHKRQAASEVPFTPQGSISAGNVQDAVAELDSETQSQLLLKANLLTTVERTSATGAAVIPSGNTAGRPTGGAAVEGLFRRNSQIKQWEGYDGANWTGIGGASGGGGNPFCYENDIHVVVDYTITANKNAMSAGPITVDSGFSVTVPSGSVWSIV